MRDPVSPSPLLRPVLHALTGLAALALGILPYPWALAAALLGVLVGWVVLPLTALEKRLRRPGEPFLCGLRTYPLAVLGLVILLDPTDAAAAWGVLAFGDAAAALVGRSWPTRALFGHAKATWSGSAAYVLIGGAAATSLSAGVAALADVSGLVETLGAPSISTCFLAALAAGILDLLPLPPDDNLPAAAAAGGVLHIVRVML